MENKLQELTKKLYDEGLSKGRADAEALLSDAAAKAKQIVADADGDAAQIRRTAEKQAADLHRNTVTELTLAGRQMTDALKAKLASMIVERAVKPAVQDAMLDSGFIKELLVAVAKNWAGSTSGQVSLKALLPAEREKELAEALRGAVGKEIGDGLEIEFSDKVKSGFRVTPRDGGYYMDFGPESFYALLGEYLRPKVREMLFGESDKDEK